MIFSAHNYIFGQDSLLNTLKIEVPGRRSFYASKLFQAAVKIVLILFVILVESALAAGAILAASSI